MLTGDQEQLLKAVLGQVEGARDLAVGELVATATIVAVLLSLGVATMRSVTRPISAMVSTMGRLAAGDHRFEIPAVQRKDEINEMGRAPLVLRKAAVAKARLEAEAEPARHAAESEREARDAEKAKETRQDQFAIETLGQSLGRLAGGDLVQLIESPFAAKTERLRKDFNASIDKLKQTMLSVVSSTETIRSSAQEMSAASEDLARRTERQATSVEETAAALQEIAANVRESAEGAAHARQVVACGGRPRPSRRATRAGAPERGPKPLER